MSKFRSYGSLKIRSLQGHCVILYLTTDAACETSEYDFRFPELRFLYTGISNTLAKVARDSFIEELEEILAGGLGGTNLFFSAW